jgi:hypothetical protein
MARRSQLAPWANKPYHPGSYSKIYHELAPGLRGKIADAVDAIFVKKTGVRRKINEHATTDQTLVRQWLLIRDAVVSWYLYQKMLIDDRARGLRLRIEAQLQASELRKRLSEVVGSDLPKASQAEEDLELASKIWGFGHTVTEGIDIVELATKGVEWAEPVMEFLGPLSVGAGLPLTLAAGLAEIAESRAAGDTDAERNAFRHGFASQLVYGRIINPLPSNSVLGHQQLRGQKAATDFLQMLKPDVKQAFLTVYRGEESYVSQNMDKALHDMGAN